MEFEGRDVTGLRSTVCPYRHRKIVSDHQCVPAAVDPREHPRRPAGAGVALRHVASPRQRWPDLIEQADELLALVGLWESRERTREDARPWRAARARNRHGAGEPIRGCLLLDEPTAGMSPEETRVMMDLIVKLASERTVILVEHKMKLVHGHQRAHPGAASRRTAGGGHARGGSPERGGQAGLSRPAGAHETDAADQKLNAWYGASHVLQDVNIEVGKGEIVCLIGRNGAGKTTTLKSIMGLLDKTTRLGHLQGPGVAEASRPMSASRSASLMCRKSGASCRD